mgnify:CR=1 FL=1
MQVGTERYQDAWPHLSTCLAYGQYMPDCNIMAGLNLVREERMYAEAAQLLRYGLYMHPARPDAWPVLAEAVLHAHGPLAAVDELRTAVRLHPDVPVIPNLLDQMTKFAHSPQGREWQARYDRPPPEP